MFEHDFDVSLQGWALLLQAIQEEYHAVLLLIVLFLNGVRVNFLNVEASAAVNLEEGDTATA